MRYVFYLILVAFVSCERAIPRLETDSILIVTNASREEHYIDNMTLYTIQAVSTVQGWSVGKGGKLDFKFKMLDKYLKYQVGDTIRFHNCH